MVYAARNNPILLQDFKDSISRYENAASFAPNDPFGKLKAAELLKMALDLTVAANPIDTFSMLRYLAKRMLFDTSKSYTIAKLLAVANTASVIGGAQLILGVPYGILKAANGILPQFDQVWFSMVNGNPAFQLFLETYQNSDLPILKTTPLTNLVRIYTPPVESRSSDSEVIVSLGVHNPRIHLEHCCLQKVKFGVDVDFAKIGDPSLPTTINAFVEIRADFGKFMLDASVKYTPAVLALSDKIALTDNLRTVGSHQTFTVPETFYVYRLEVLSRDCGMSWTVVGLEILPPSA